MNPAADARTDLVRACFREPVTRTPVWFMRQAGRSLPEYRAARGGGSILSAIGDAALSAELTLQPVRRYGVDAAVVFSDIVVPVHAIGFGVEVEQGRGPVVAEPFRSAADLSRLRPFEPEADAPYVAETVRLVAAELAGSKVSLIGFAGAPFTVASYLVEGGPSRTFARVKALMHGEPGLWEQLTDRLAAMAVASLRSQVVAGAQAVQLFDSWAGSLSPAEYTRFALPATRRVIEGIADLGVPAILFGVGTGELLATMGTAGADVVGVDWRVPLDEARRRVGAGCAVQGNLDPAVCLAPWPVVEDATRHGPRPGGRRHRHRPRLQPRPRRPARDRSGDPRRRRRARAHGDRPHVTVGVLLMAHGTPASPEEIEPFYTRIRRGRPPDAAQLAELEARYRALGGVSPLAERTAAQVDAVRDVLAARAPGRYVVTFGAKHTDPLIEVAAEMLAATGPEKVVGLVLTPHGSSMGSQEYLDRAAAALERDGTPFVAVDRWYAEPGFVALLAGRVTDAVALALAPAPAPARVPARGRVAVLFTAHSVPERVRAAGDTYPDQLAQSARLVATAAGLDRWHVAWQSAGRTPEPWLGPDVRDEVRRLAEEGETDTVVVCPIGFVADHLEVLYDLDIELAAVAASSGLGYVRTASLNDDPAFISVLADVIRRADGA